MAEAAVERPVAARFFCHQCVQEVHPVLPDYLCSRCHSGFIEELTQAPAENVRPRPRSQEIEEENPFTQISDVWNILNTMRRSESLDQSRNQANWTQPGPSSSNRQDDRLRHDDRRIPRGESGFIFNFLHSLSTGLIPSDHFPIFVNLHGNPGDYAWGRGGWNTIITQLINQLDGTGPPPLPRDKINEIPTVNITQDQVAKNLQCTVCMEDFKLGEPTRLLSCQHHFHNDCIIPWLELHGTCPICRKLLTDDGSHPSSPYDSQTFTANPNRQRTDSPTNPNPNPNLIRQRTESPNPNSQRTETSNPRPSSSSGSYRARSPHNTTPYYFADDCD